MKSKTPSQIGAYEVIAQIGSGGMATIYRAHQPRLARDVAIKLIHSNLAQDSNYIARFEREAKIIARLDHPNIVPLYDYAEYNGQPYLVMKYIDGTTLKELLRKGSLSLAAIRDLMKKVAYALEYAHDNGVLHRDIKPSNILLDRNGTPYLTDFGLARIIRQGESTLSTDMMLGTPQYISPEQARGGNIELDERTDIYSLGVLLYELVVGRVPFVSESAYGLIFQHIYDSPPAPSQLNPEVPASVEQVLLKALNKEPQDRYRTPLAMMSAFEKAVAISGLTSLDDDRQSIAQQRSSILAAAIPESDSGRFVTVPAPGQVSTRQKSQNFWVALSERVREGVADVKERIEQTDIPGEIAARRSDKAKRSVAGDGWQSPTESQQVVHLGNEYGMDENSIRRRVNQRLQRKRNFYAYAGVYMSIIVLTLVFAQPAFINSLDAMSTQPEVMEAFARVGGNFLEPLRELNFAGIVALLGAGGVLSRGIRVFYDSGSRLETKQRRIEEELRDAYGPSWKSNAGESAYYRVRNRIEQASRRNQGLLSHFFSAIFLTLGFTLAWSPISEALQIFAIEASQFATLLDLPIPGIFAAIMLLTFLGHLAILGFGRLLSAEPSERLVAQELERELQNSGLSRMADKKKNQALPDDLEQYDDLLIDPSHGIIDQAQSK